jgi:hypothetical protein
VVKCIIGPAGLAPASLRSCISMMGIAKGSTHPTDSRGAKSDARKIEFVEAVQSALPCPSLHISHRISDFPKLSLTLDPNHLRIPRHPVPREGALAIVTDVGAGSGGRGCAFDEQRVRRTAKSCGPDAPVAGVKFLRSKILRDDGDKQARSRRGEHDISRRTIAQGRPDCFR